MTAAVVPMVSVDTTLVYLPGVFEPVAKFTWHCACCERWDRKYHLTAKIARQAGLRHRCKGPRRAAA